jgi:hypothetical protein
MMSVKNPPLAPIIPLRDFVIKTAASPMIAMISKAILASVGHELLMENPPNNKELTIKNAAQWL